MATDFSFIEQNPNLFFTNSVVEHLLVHLFTYTEFWEQGILSYKYVHIRVAIDFQSIEKLKGSIVTVHISPVATLHL